MNNLKKRIRFRTLKSINKRNAKEVLQKYAGLSENGKVTCMFGIEKSNGIEVLDIMGAPGKGRILITADTMGKVVDGRLETEMTIKLHYNRWAYTGVTIPPEIIEGPVNVCWIERN